MAPAPAGVLQRHMEVSGRAAAVAAALIASLALVVGWVLPGTGTDLLPDMQWMKVNSALAALLLVTAIAVHARWRTPVARIAVAVLALAVLALGLATLAEDVLRRDLGIDTLLLPDEEGRTSPGAPGRMSPFTSASFAFLGLGLLIVDVDHGRRVCLHEVLAMLGFLLPLFYFSSALYGAPVFATVTQMAPSTIATLFALAWALFTIRPRDGLAARLAAPTGGGFLLRRMLPLSAILILGLGLGRNALASQGVPRPIVDASFAIVLVIGAALLVMSVSGSLDRLERDRAMAEAQALAARREAMEEGVRRSLLNAKMQFVNRAAHELNTPLTPLVTQVALLRAQRLGPLTERQERSLAMLERNVARLARVVQKILAAAEVEHMGFELKRMPTDLGGLAAQRVQSFGPLAQGAHVELSVMRKGDVVADVDPRRFATALDNLLTNAIKACGGGGRVHVRVWAEGGDAMVRVEDSGCGLSPAALASLFRPFHEPQEGDANEPTGAGLGLGLHLVRTIMEAHGGRVEADSQGVGHGAVFTLRVPLATAALGVGPGFVKEGQVERRG